MLLACSHVFGRHTDDTVRIDVKRDFDLRDTTGCLGNSFKEEFAQCYIVLGKLAFTLEHMDLDCRLVIGRGAEYLRTAGWNGGVSFNHWCRYATQCLNPKTEGCHVEKEDIGHTFIANDDTCLKGGAHGNCLIRIDSLEWRLTCFLLDSRLNSRNSSTSSNEEYLVDVSGLHASILDCASSWAHGRLDEVGSQIIELSTGQIQI